MHYQSTMAFPPPVLSLSRGEVFERGLIHAVESVVVEWSHQIRDVLQRSSAQPLLKGKNPGPLVELNFWKDRRADLESVMDQVNAGHPLYTYTVCKCGTYPSSYIPCLLLLSCLLFSSLPP